MNRHIIAAGLAILLSWGISFASENVIVNKTTEELTANLANMPIEDKLNAEMRLLLNHTDDPEAHRIAREFESLWNSGNFDEALERYSELGEVTDLNKVLIGHKWREPIVTHNLDKMSDNYRVGTRDSVYVVNYDVQRSTGNILAILLLRGDGYVSRMTVNFSDDGGVTWYETFWIASTGSTLLDADCAIYGNHGLATLINLGTYILAYKIDMSNGQWIFFESGESYSQIYSASGEVFEIDLESNQDLDNHATRLNKYFMVGREYGKLLFIWSQEEGDSWNTSSPISLPHVIERGLDLAIWEDGGIYSTMHPYLVSFISTNDYINIYGYNNSVAWDELSSVFVGPGSEFTSIDAYNEHIYSAFTNTYDYMYIRATHNRGTTWELVTTGDFNEEYAPALTTRAGSGLAVAYHEVISNPPIYFVSSRIKYGDYDYTPWTKESTFSLPNVLIQPKIEQLQSGQFGALGVRITSTVKSGAYFSIVGECCHVPGDANGDGTFNVGDAVFLINHVFKGGSGPGCATEADANQDGGVNVGDAVYMINTVFKSGPNPACP